MTLGRARGAALLGQPLELTVSVQTAPDESVSSECFEADVFYGENRQDGGRVRVSAPVVVAGQAMAVKVSSSAAIDEPIVTVYFRGGCGQKTTRKYVLLADMASEPAAPTDTAAATAPRVAAAPVTPGPKLVAVAPTVQAAVPESGNDRQVASKKSRTPTAKSPSANTLRAAERLAKQGSAEPVVKRPRLKLAAIDLAERDPVLRLSNELLSAPLEDLQKRAEAIALWRSLNTTAQDVLNEQTRTQTLDADVKSLREQTAKNQAALTELVGRLEKAESQRYANPLVYGLFALLIALLAGLAWAWRRLREANVDPYPWWNSKDDVAPIADTRVTGRESTAHPVARAESGGGELHKTGAYTTQPPTGGGMQSVDIDIDFEAGPSIFSASTSNELPEKQAQPKAMHSGGVALDTGARGFAHSVAGTLRAINSHELLDVRQQADFFMTLGQYEDAIELLEANIRDSGESNPLVYLDLLKILHTLSRKDGFDRYRDEFNDLFTGQVPEYNHFNQPGRRLEEYPQACAEICAAWNSPSALDVIEGYLVRTQGHDSHRDFDLEAYRELLMLHAVAGRVDGATESRLAPFSATKPAAHEGGLDFSLDSASASLGAETTPMQAAGVDGQKVDFDLSAGGHNLIDFEVSGISKTGPANTGKN